MVKILLGLVAAVVIAVGGFFGFEFYTQHRIARDVEAAFEQIRATGGKASHGKIAFDLKSRTLRIEDIAAESASQPPLTVKIGGVTVSGVRQPDPTRSFADSIEITDIEVGAASPTQTLARVTYKAPRIALKDYSGPAAVQRLPASSSLIDLYRFAFEQLASITAASVAAPNLTATMKFSAAMPSGRGEGEFAYSGLAMEGIKDGKISSVKVDEFVLTANQPAGKTKKVTANLTALASYDIDIGAMAAIFDPKNSDDRYHRIYRQISAGAYKITIDQTLNMRIDGFTIDDIGIGPSRMQLPALMAIMSSTSATAPAPAQARELLDKMATLYEGIRIGNAEIRGLSADTPAGPFKLATTRFNLEDGKVGEFAVEGLDANTPKGPFKLERFALKSLDITNFMRLSAQFANPAQAPAPELFAGLFPLIGGVEVKGITAPFKNTGRFVNLERFDVNWGQFVGPIPSKIRVTAKLETPVDASDPAMRGLIAAGIDPLSADGDIGVEWTEAARSFVLDVPKLEIGGLLKASARIALANVPRQVFSANAAQAIGASAQIEAGTIELTVRDLGGVDLAVAHYAGTANISRDAARQAIVQELKDGGAEMASSNPDARALIDSLARFIETPGTTLTIKLTPLGKVPAIQLFKLLQTDPLAALAQFRLEAATPL